jgi:hypothetical protein
VPDRIVVVGVTNLSLYGFPLAVAWFAELLRILEEQDAAGLADRNLGGTGGSGPCATGWDEPRRTGTAPCDRLARQGQPQLIETAAWFSP